MKRIYGVVVGLGLVLASASAQADVSASAYAGALGAEGRPTATRLGFDFLYGIKPYFQWGGDFFVSSGEPFLRFEFGPKVKGFFDPFNSPFRIAVEGSIGPAFFQLPEAKIPLMDSVYQTPSHYEVGSVVRYGGGLGAQFGGRVNPFFILGAHGVTRLDREGTDIYGFLTIGFSVPSGDSTSTSSGGGEEEE